MKWSLFERVSEVRTIDSLLWLRYFGTESAFGILLQIAIFWHPDFTLKVFTGIALGNIAEFNCCENLIKSDNQFSIFVLKGKSSSRKMKSRFLC